MKTKTKPLSERKPRSKVAGATLQRIIPAEASLWAEFETERTAQPMAVKPNSFAAYLLALGLKTHKANKSRNI